MNILREKKVFFIDALKPEVKFLLNFVQQKEIITTREYENLYDSNHNNEKITIDLLNKVMAKGDMKCQEFLELLQTKEIYDTFPKLELHFTKPTTSSIEQPREAKIVDIAKINQYTMSHEPRGFCLIINNMKFQSSFEFRNGSEQDEESLRKVFQWLGFIVVVAQNQTAQEIKVLLKSYSQKQHDGDCFVCCILSHGSEDGVFGVDGYNVSKSDIIDPFNGGACPSLAGKPKVFFIQACRGTRKQPAVKVQSDSLEEESAYEEEDLDMDALQMIDIPKDADFLVVRSTVKGYLSYRSPVSGSWFIQSLCKQLERLCPMGEDINTVLLCMNEEVSKMPKAKGGIVKQMPIHKVTLRKKLVFPVPEKNKRL